MKKEEGIKSLFISFGDIAGKVGIDYIEYRRNGGSKDKPLTHKFTDDFKPGDPGPLEKEKILNREAAVSGEEKIFISQLPAAAGHLVLQGRSPLHDEYSGQVEFLAKAAGIINQTSPDTGKGEDDRYRRELINLREMQAQLYPRFEDITGYEISSAFLPAELMSGNFVESIQIDRNTWQIAVCDIAGYDASSSFTGAAVRTILRSEPVQKISPSRYIEMIINRLKKIKPGLQELIHLSIYQLNSKTGGATLSSFGKLNTYFYNETKKGFVDLSQTKAGMVFEKKNFHKDISLTLAPGDGLLYYSKGLINAKGVEKEETYGETRLGENFIKEQDSSPMELVHSIVDTVYEFTDYTPQEKDIILFYAKRTG